MPDRRADKRRSSNVAGLMGAQLWMCVARRPIDALAIFATTVTALVIVINATFMQAGAQPASFVMALVPPPAPAETTATAAPAAQSTLKTADLAPARTMSTPAPQQATAVPLPVPAPRRSDPIADLINPSPRIQAVQRVLSEFGYGQIKLTGVLDTGTSEAITKFQREHNLPVTGRVSDKLLSALGTMAGHPIN